jgi:Na+/phosphate symporter
MILMWLPPVLLMIFGLEVFRRGFSQLLAPLQQKFLQLPEDAGTFRKLIVTKLCSVGFGSFVQTQHSAVALLNSRSFSRHFAVLLLCLSAAGLWTTLVAVLLAWKINGGIFAGLLILAYLSYQATGRARAAVYIFGGAMALLAGAQWALQMQSLLMSLLGESDFHFFLADGRLSAQLALIALSFVLTILFSIESWAVLLALVLLVAGSLSLNGAVAMVIGELLAQVWILWWRSRQLNQDAKETTKSYALVSTLGLFIALVGTGFVRDIFAWELKFDTDLITERSLQFTVMYLVVIIAQCLAVLTWGHFAARKKVDEVQTGEYFPTSWITKNLVAESIATYLIAKLRDRLDLLIAQKKSLNTQERAQIPQNFLNEHEQEITKLSQWLKNWPP